MTDSNWFTLRWNDGAVELLDQTLLPEKEHYLRLDQVEDLACAIERLSVRGAPAIGVAAALGVALGAFNSEADRVDDLRRELDEEVIPRLRATRPTAVNLFWALDRMQRRLHAGTDSEGFTAEALRANLLEEAQGILAEDIRTCRQIGVAGLEVVETGARILTHCNAGALATGGYGTALGVVRAASEAGRKVTVLADETRPLLQGARLTAWELQRDQIPVRVCTDNMAGAMMQAGKLDLVVVGADRIAANGDVANKIGTYAVAVLAKAHEIPFYVAAPLSTIDRSIATGADIPIEIRDREEVARIGDRVVLPEGVEVEQPAFDVTPAKFVTGIITEKGVLRSPYGSAIDRAFSQ
ncbi:MAG: S-methyl-5-thioribose-1-phosphate isomerase [bacterium TMED88]|nr:S-methyl-5-thioribose-1-phosphate isomerase [Deltaproteobacteria bacterium]OUV29695.1 MAG: S-methyl-5-thioribose-1-phosphate isomerase [bacterium TMED88]